MAIKLKFLGAAQNVTGSRHLLEANGTRILVDCGLYQERQFKDRNWDPNEVPPSSIDAVLLTHAHLDHCGLLPKLCKEGFKGKIYCTPATAEIAQIILLDSAKLQEEDAEFKNKRHKKEGRDVKKAVPLYTVEEAEVCFPQFQSVEYKKPLQLTGGIKAVFCDAGHVLGSSIIQVCIDLNSERRSVLFSGDVGRANRPILQDPQLVDLADYILIESTYGDRIHHETDQTKSALAEVINSTIEAGGNIIIPSFALERSQEVLYYINELIVEKTIPNLKVFLDSPMAARITKVFQKHRELFDEEMRAFISNGESPFKFEGLTITGSTEESKAINNIKGPIMVIAGSGMCTGGRIKHHLVNNISDPKNTILFVGYQAMGTLGRRIVNGEKEIRILGQVRQVEARVERVHGFSAHADKEELLEWLRALKKAPRKIFVVHGEAESANHFAEFMREKTGWQLEVPAYKDEAILD